MMLAGLIRSLGITTRLVDTVSTPMLLKLVQSGKLDPSKLITHSTLNFLSFSSVISYLAILV